MARLGCHPACASLRLLEMLVRDPELLADWQAFWEQYFQPRPLGAGALLAASLDVDPSAVAKWRRGETFISAANVSRLIQLHVDGSRSSPPGSTSVLTSREADGLLRLALRTAGFAPNLIEVLLTQGNQRYKRTAEQTLEKTVRWVELITQLDRELFDLLRSAIGGTPLKSEHGDMYIFSLFDRACELFGQGHDQRPLVHRCCIYLPDRTSMLLRISDWEVGTGHQARMFNCWYIGPDPVPPGLYRGLQGLSYVSGEAKAYPDVWSAEGFHNPYGSKKNRNSFPFRSALYVPILVDTHKVGLLSFDSWRYTFTSSDCALVSLVAERLGWVVQLTRPDLVAQSVASLHARTGDTT